MHLKYECRFTPSILFESLGDSKETCRFGKRVNFMGATAFSFGNTGVCGCSTDHLWLILKCVQIDLM